MNPSEIGVEKNVGEAQEYLGYTDLYLKEVFEKLFYYSIVLPFEQHEKYSIIT